VGGGTPSHENMDNKQEGARCDFIFFFFCCWKKKSNNLRTFYCCAYKVRDILNYLKE